MSNQSHNDGVQQEAYTTLRQIDTPAASRLWLVAWVVWTLVIMSTATMPLSNYVGHAHWNKVCWVPFRDRVLPGFWLDALANVALYAPFGFLGMRSQFRWSCAGTLRLLGVAALVSVAGEIFQTFCHNRFPSTTDVLMNVMGAAAGAIAARIFLSAAVLPGPERHSLIPQ